MTGAAALAAAAAGLAVLVLLLPRGLAAAARLGAVLPPRQTDPAASVVTTAPRRWPGWGGRGSPGSVPALDGGGPRSAARPGGRAPADRAPADQASADWAFADRAPADWASAARAPADWASADRAPADWTPANRASADRAPADRTPADWATADRAPADWTPADWTPVDRAPADRTPTDRESAPPPPWTGLLPAVLAAAGAAALLPPALAAVALPVGLAVHRLARRREPVALRRDRLRAELDLPPALDLLAACLAAGASLGEALGAVGAVTAPPLRRPLLEAAAALDLGAPADQALAAWEREPALAGLGSALAAAVGGGTPLAGTVRRLADDRRARAAAARLAAARRVGVQVVLPLGVCFLPAFVLVGVVPVVAGVAGRITP